jgi:hypothetical protein
MKQALQSGWADKSFFDTAKAALAEWSENPDSFRAHTMCEAVGWKK